MFYHGKVVINDDALNLNDAEADKTLKVYVVVGI